MTQVLIPQCQARQVRVTRYPGIKCLTRTNGHARMVELNAGDEYARALQRFFRQRAARQI